jgi:hypothetical protein
MNGNFAGTLLTECNIEGKVPAKKHLLVYSQNLFYSIYETDTQELHSKTNKHATLLLSLVHDILI